VNALGIDAVDFVGHYPRLYHMAQDGAWDSIRRHGLLSTSALLDLFQINGDLRRQIESCHRPKSREIAHPEHGTAVIRDQQPMSDSGLLKCLCGMTPRDWYELLNRKVFFWVREERVRQLLDAMMYRNSAHTVITLETASMLRVHQGRTTLSPINSGSTLYNPRPRGADTFLPLHEYPFDVRRKKAGLARAIAELAVDYSVPDVLNHVVRVERRKGSRVLEKLL
jgi:hypothetical protein